MNTPVQAGPKAGRRFWQTHLKALATSGFSRSEYCRRHNLSYHALTYWVRKQQEISPVKPPLALVEVPVRPSLPLRSGAAALHLHLDCGRMLEIDPDFDEAALGRILTVLAQQSSRLSRCRRYRYAQVHRHPGGTGYRASGPGSVVQLPVRFLQPETGHDQDPLLGPQRFLPVAQTTGAGSVSLAGQRIRSAAALCQGAGLAARRPVNRTGGTPGDPL